MLYAANVAVRDVIGTGAPVDVPETDDVSLLLEIAAN